mmetsp:Transcript_45362/g.176233  ORF Transcript_45362/g.176233 Transcript_45362/m.176233 type:complete len:325 (+) Transcript_45362:767-1741(+)|eukprot:CAMPEP_0113958964 /NCGR_PEP_ID=MMETSP0011_2-20120614/3849_1 /TAXON_ID=101924 /ORGANISM="Rhodosorus marinus" /LENGTH=324 /DNA_ID=CAMNT_0000970159 /DNA_START=735 /DNA_END=1709 /DNA_ORIENTATION=- /assembly_acc=CAM_ASM_000156
MMRAVIARDKVLRMVERAVPVPSGSEVLVKIAYAGVNRADLLQKDGHYPPPAGASDIIGLECSGTIEALGNEAHKFRVGDRVAALLKGGGYSEYVAIDQGCVGKVPDEMKLSEAAAIPEVWTTAYQLVHRIARTRPTDTVLVHAAGSGVGLAAVQLASSTGASVIATARSAAKLEVAMQLGAAAGVKPSWTEETGTRFEVNPVNVILDPVGAKYWDANLHSLATDGRWVVYGSLGGVRVAGVDLGLMLRKRLSIYTTTLRSRSLDYQGALFTEAFNEIVPKIVQGEFKNRIFEQYNLDAAEEAHTCLKDNRNIGKVVLKVGESD